MSPSEKMREAATKLRAQIAALGDNRGPWYIVDPSRYPQAISNIGVPLVVADTFQEPTKPLSVAPYIATMHPGVALRLVALLEELADQYDGPACDAEGGCCNNCHTRPEYGFAEILAVAITGGAS